MSSGTQFTRLLAAAFVLAAPFCFSASPAQSFAYDECGGVPIIWRQPAVLAINTTSFPFNGPFDRAFGNAMGEWNDVGGSHFGWYYYHTNDFTVEPGNDKSEVYAYDLRELDEGAAVAIAVTYDDCEDGITETDIIFDTQDRFTTGAFDYRKFNRENGDVRAPFHFEHAALHELGHGLGLKHFDQVLDTMNGGVDDIGGGTIGPSKRWMPLPDSRRGIRFLYPEGSTEYDLAGSVFKRSGAGDDARTRLVVYNTGGGLTAGDRFGFEFTLLNLGTFAEKTKVAFYLSKNETISTSDTHLATSGTVTLPAGSIQTFTSDLKIPPTVKAGTYWIGFILDKDNKISERIEGNNKLASWVSFNIAKQPTPPTLFIPFTTGDFVSSGPERGPFTPASKTYLLYNAGERPLDWTASSDQNWLRVAPSTGTLDPGASVKVDASVSASIANKLNVGTYSGTLKFINNSNGRGDTTRRSTLTVERRTYKITLSSSGGGGARGAGEFKNGSTRSVTATAQPEWMFDNWTDPRGRVVSTSNPYTFVLNSDTTLRANFVVPYEISLGVSPSGAGTVTGGGQKKPNTQVRATATANPGFRFRNWTEEGTIVSTASIYRFTVESHRSLVANFGPASNDLLVDFGTEGVWAYFNNDPNSWIRIWGSGGANAAHIEAADLDGDYKDELVLLTPYDPAGPSGGVLYRVNPVTQQETYLQNMRVALAFTSGDFDGGSLGQDDLFGRFGGSGAPYMRRLNGGAWTDVAIASPLLFDHLISADLNGNGMKDVIGYGSSTDDPTVGIRALYDNGASFTMISAGDVVAAAAGDLNANGKADIAFAVSDRVLLFRDDNNFTATPQSAGGATKLHFADADGDGKDELYKLKRDGLWRMAPNLSWSLVVESQRRNSIRALGSADLDSDGKQDILIQENGVVSARMNNQGSFVPLHDFPIGVAEGFAAGSFD